MNTKNLVVSALLIAVSILIPIIFAPFRIIVGPYTATLTAHVPVILAMFISPLVAVLVAVVSSIGFLVTSTPIVAIRALTHLIFALIGVYMIKNHMNIWLTLVVTGIAHAVAEALVVFIAFKIGAPGVGAKFTLGVLVGVTAAGTFVHHTIDFLIALLLYKPIRATRLVELYPVNYSTLKA